MVKLSKSVYGGETDSKKTPFGLLNNQMKADSIINNAGWFNVDGEKLGSGDLSLRDIDNISKLISTQELFIALNEFDWKWNIPSDLDAAAPGKEYIFQKASWVVSRDSLGPVILRVRDDVYAPKSVTKDGIKYLRVPRSALFKALKYEPIKKKLPSSEKKLPTPIAVATKSKSKPITGLPPTPMKPLPIKKVSTTLPTKLSPSKPLTTKSP